MRQQLSHNWHTTLAAAAQQPQQQYTQQQQQQQQQPNASAVRALPMLSATSTAEDQVKQHQSAVPPGTSLLELMQLQQPQQQQQQQRYR
jgi:hypothetical protein